jgi:hypothetical protein
VLLQQVTQIGDLAIGHVLCCQPRGHPLQGLAHVKDLD